MNGLCHQLSTHSLNLMLSNQCQSIKTILLLRQEKVNFQKSLTYNKPLVLFLVRSLTNTAPILPCHIPFSQLTRVVRAQPLSCISLKSYTDLKLLQFRLYILYSLTLSLSQTFSFFILLAHLFI